MLAEVNSSRNPDTVSLGGQPYVVALMWAATQGCPYIKQENMRLPLKACGNDTYSYF